MNSSSEGGADPSPDHHSFAANHSFHRLFEESQDAILLTTQEGEIIDVNPAACSLLGYDRDDFVGMSADELVGDASTYDPFAPDIITKGGGTGFEVHLAARDGREVIGSMSLTVFPEEAADRSLLLCIIHDITQEYHLKRELLDLQEDERRRIGRDLHDSIGSQLVGTIVRLDRYIQNLDQGKEVTADELRQVREDIAESAEQMRDISHGLDPMRLGPTFLMPALEQLADRMSSESSLTCQVDGPSHDLDLSDEQATHLYRIAQEATTNALKHSSASRIEIDLEKTAETLVLKIRDDGDGFDPGPGTIEGLGLRSMRYRAELINAHFEISSTPGEGTLVRCRLSLTQES